MCVCAYIIHHLSHTSSHCHILTFHSHILTCTLAHITFLVDGIGEGMVWAAAAISSNREGVNLPMADVDPSLLSRREEASWLLVQVDTLFNSVC